MRFNNFCLGGCLILFVAVSLLNLNAIYASKKPEPNSNPNTYRPSRFYHRTQRREPNRIVTSGAVRGQCPGETTTVSLLLLAPPDHLGLTAQTHPTFFWYLNQPTNQPRTLKFTLVEMGQTEPLLEQNLIADTSSSITLMQFTVPDTVAPLKVNHTYKWTITIICNPQRPSSNYFSSTTFKMVLVEPNPLQYSPEEEAISLARKGIWYDSLYYANLSTNSDLFTELLKEANIFLSLD